MGTTTQTTNASVARTGLPPVDTSLYPAGVPHIQNVTGGPGSRPMTPHGFQPGHGQPSSEPVSSPVLHHPQTTAAASVLNNLNNKNTIEKQPPGEEFNHAILYLNKIKARYSDEPNVYKQFLDILQTYQKEQKHVQDVSSSLAQYGVGQLTVFLLQSQVYVQVQILFKDAPDLLSEFKDFLPDAVPANIGPGGIPIMPQVSGGSWESSPPNVSGNKSTQASKRNRKRVPEKDPTPVLPAKSIPSRVCRAC